LGFEGKGAEKEVNSLKPRANTARETETLPSSYQEATQERSNRDEYESGDHSRSY
jgi:hypothetical protein